MVATLIDTHAHFWIDELVAASWNPPAPLDRTYEPDDWQREIGTTGIAGCIFVEAGHAGAELELLERWSAESPSILGFVAPVATDGTDVDAVLVEWRDVRAFKGVRAHFEDGDADLLRAPGLQPGLATLADSDVLFEFLVTGDQLAEVLRLCTGTPDLRVVIEHMGKPRLGQQVEVAWKESMRAIAADTQSVVKLSMSPRPDEFARLAQRGPGLFPSDSLARHVDLLLEFFTPERLVWGSDWPVSLLTATTPDFIAGWRRILEPIDDQLTATARRVYRL